MERQNNQMVEQWNGRILEWTDKASCLQLTNEGEKEKENREKEEEKKMIQLLNCAMNRRS